MDVWYPQHMIVVVDMKMCPTLNTHSVPSVMSVMPKHIVEGLESGERHI